MVLKKEQSTKFHVISLFLAVLLISGGIISYSWLYKNNSYRFSYEKFMYMGICIELILLGTILVLINIKKDLVGKIVLVIFGFVMCGVLFNNLVRLGVILSVVTMFSYLIVMKFKNIFSTIITMSVCAMVFFVLLRQILKLVDKEYVLVVVYSMSSLYIVVYRAIGKKLNHWFIANVMGFKKESETYDDAQLKNQILLIYMVTFVLINLWVYLGKMDEHSWNLINNSFLTGLAIIQIDWNKLIGLNYN